MANKSKKVLGRGLNALIRNKESTLQEYDQATQSPSIKEVSLDRITLNPEQPRLAFDLNKLQELTQSIKVKGVLQPLLVRFKDGNYELIAGERRFKAARMAGLEKVPVIIKNVKDEDMLEIALIENIQRHDLNPIEEAKAYQALLLSHNYTQEDLSKRIGKNRSTIANLIRLLSLPENIQEKVFQGNLSTGHVRTLVSVDDERLKQKICQEILDNKLSVRDSEKLVKAVLAPKKEKIIENLNTQMLHNQNRLCEKFATKVQLLAKGNKGKILLEYFSLEDFNRIYTMLLKSEN